MAYKDINGLERANGERSQDESSTETLKLQIMGETVDLPHDSFVRDADISRENMDLVLDSNEGTIIIQDYFAGFESPALTAPNGASLSPQLVNSFISGGNEYANAETTSDVSPIGAVQEISGDATITRLNGTTETLSIGSPVYQGDVIETNSDSAVNVVFVDESSFAVSEETRLAIDEYVFDPASQGGVQNFSVLKGVFVYTSGLIGREDPDDVTIDTPVGSIGIRGTIIAGDVDQGEITVVEGAIVLRNPLGEEMTLANQFETGKFTSDRGIQNLGQKTANDVTEKFSIVSNVAPTLFSSINDAAAEGPQAEPAQDAKPMDRPTDAPLMDADKPVFDADGATDQDGDSEVDGTVDDGGAADGDDGAMLDGMKDNAEQKQVESEASDGSAMNPMVMQIAQAMGIMDGGGNPMNANAGNMSGAMGGMQGMAAMGMASERLAEGETVMKMLNDAMEDSPADGPTAGMNPMDRPPIDSLNPNIIDQIAANINNGTNTISAPVNLRGGAIDGVGFNQKSIAPDAFFASGEGTTWNYHFDKEFGGPTTGFKLDGATVSMLDNNINITSWTFDGNNTGFGNAHGELIITFKDIFSGIALNGNATFNINIEALNAGGSSGFNTYNFDLYDAIAWGTTGSDISGNNIVANQPGNAGSSFIEIGQTATTDNSKFFFGAGDDQNIQIGITNAVTDSTINLGDGNNSANVFDGSINNRVIGGDNSDNIGLQEAIGSFHGMDGDDTFSIDITSGSNVLTDLTTNNQNILIDGGHDNFRALNLLNGITGPVGRGDSLNLDGDGSIDFTTIDDAYIKGIEIIQLSQTNNQTVTLNYQDVIQMTNNRNTLLIRADGGDTVNLNGFTANGFSNIPTHDDISIDDNVTYTATIGDDTNFDVYKNAAGVTIIVEDTGATVNVA